MQQVLPLIIKLKTSMLRPMYRVCRIKVIILVEQQISFIPIKVLMPDEPIVITTTAGISTALVWLMIYLKTS
ncbi:hypothetical protein D3C87_1824050 [compost metagenome]